MELDELSTHDNDTNQADKIAASPDEATERLIQVSNMNPQRSLGRCFHTYSITVSMRARVLTPQSLPSDAPTLQNRNTNVQSP